MTTFWKKWELRTVFLKRTDFRRNIDYKIDNLQKTCFEYYLSAIRRSFDLWTWQTPHFKAYFKSNLKGLIDLCRIIDRFKATEQNISLSYFQSNFWGFVYYNCDNKLILILWPRILAKFWGVCHWYKSRNLRMADKWNSEYTKKKRDFSKIADLLTIH